MSRPDGRRDAAVRAGVHVAMSSWTPAALMEPRMSKTQNAGAAATTVVNAEDRELTSSERLRIQADALYRAANECSHQQERAARLGNEPGVAAERKLARQMCTLAAAALGEMAAAYERVAARHHPESPEQWWRRANILWLAAREYQFHHEGCNEISQQLDNHDPGMLSELHLQYELAASALLALRQAADGYRKAREAGG